MIGAIKEIKRSKPKATVPTLDSKHILFLQLYKVCGPYVVTLLKQCLCFGSVWHNIWSEINIELTCVMIKQTMSTKYDIIISLIIYKIGKV